MSVYKRGGVYWYDFWFQGERYRSSTGLSNRTAARSVEAIRKAELAEGRAGIINRPPCPTFESFVTTEYLPWSEREHQAHPRTHQRYKVSARPLKGFFGNLKLDAVSPGHVEKFKLARGQNVSPAGVNRDMAALRVMLNLAIRQGYILRNPVYIGQHVFKSRFGPIEREVPALVDRPGRAASRVELAARFLWHRYRPGHQFELQPSLALYPGGA